MYAKKSLGQHFLKSERALQTIVEASELTPYDTVLEIGPGQGVLTEKLLTSSREVVAVEKDDGLYVFLKEKFQKETESKKLILLNEDILTYELPDISYKLVANIPYNITGAILEKFLSAEHQPERIVLLVQKEVAERIVARDSKESILSLSVKAYGTPHYVERVLAGSFAPAPQVDSAIIYIDNISKDFFKGFTEKDFFDMLHKAFTSKRKKLSSNLVSYGKERVGEAFTKLNLDPNTRAEDVAIEIWGKLATYLLKTESETR